MPWSPGTSSLFQSSSGGGPPTKPVRRARPGSELARRIFVVPFGEGELVGSHFIRDCRRGMPAKTNRGGETVSTGRGHAVADVVEPGNDRRLGGRVAGAAMALCARPEEYRLTLLFERSEGRIGVGQRCDARGDGVGERRHTGAAEQGQLERGEVVQRPLGGRLLHLGVVDEGRQRLILKCADTGVQLVTAAGVRPARHEDVTIGSGQRDVVDGGNGAPDVDERFGGWLVRRGVDESDVRAAAAA